MARTICPAWRIKLWQECGNKCGIDAASIPHGHRIIRGSKVFTGYETPIEDGIAEIAIARIEDGIIADIASEVIRMDDSYYANWAVCSKHHGLPISLKMEGIHLQEAIETIIDRSGISKTSPVATWSTHDAEIAKRIGITPVVIEPTVRAYLSEHDYGSRVAQRDGPSIRFTDRRMQISEIANLLCIPHGGERGAASDVDIVWKIIWEVSGG